MIRGMLVFAVLQVGAAAAFAWLGPINVTYDSNSDGGDFFPDMASDSQNNLHMVWCDLTADGNWHTRHRIRYTNGTWSGITLLSTGMSKTYWVRCAMDAGDNLHVAWYNTNGADITTCEVYYRKRLANGTWGSIVNVSNTPATGSIYPDIAADGLGRVFVAWHESIPDGGDNWEVAMAVFDGSNWQPYQAVGSSTQIDAYPVLAVDGSNTLHMAYTWDYQDIYYKSRTAADVWSGPVNISHNAGSSRDPHIAVSAGGTPHVVWHDNASGEWEYLYATKVNGVWQNPVNLSNTPTEGTDCYGAVAVSPDGSVHAVWQDYQNIFYTRNTGAGWPPATLLYSSSYNTKHVVVWCDSSADAHIAWQNKPAGQDWDVMYMMKDYPDLTPPSQVSALTAHPASTKVQLTWTNPTELDYVGTVLRYKTTGYPVNAADGTLLYGGPAAKGSEAAFTHTGLTNGVPCYYAVFTYDDSYNYSAGGTIPATPALSADHDRDGDVDQIDFGLFQTCYSGAFVAPAAECQWADLDADNDVDQDDSTSFINCISGPTSYADPACAG